MIISDFKSITCHPFVRFELQPIQLPLWNWVHFEIKCILKLTGRLISYCTLYQVSHPICLDEQKRLLYLSSRRFPPSSIYDYATQQASGECNVLLLVDWVCFLQLCHCPDFHKIPNVETVKALNGIHKWSVCWVTFYCITKAHKRTLTFGLALYGLQLTAIHKIST